MPSRTAMAGAALWLAALTACRSSPSSPAATPAKIVFAETTYDFGHIVQGRPVTHGFGFRNPGGLDLTIDNVRASCACSAVTASKVVPPGGTGSVDVTFDTTEEVGRKVRTITVYSNDPAQPVTALTLVGDIAAVVAADPPRLYVGHVRRGEAVRHDVRVIAPNAAALGPALSDGTVISANVEEAGSDRGRRLRMTIKADAPRGPFRENVRLHTSDVRRPVLVVPVAGRVDVPFVPRLEVEPPPWPNRR